MLHASFKRISLLKIQVQTFNGKLSYWDRNFDILYFLHFDPRFIVLNMSFAESYFPILSKFKLQKGPSNIILSNATEFILKGELSVIYSTE